MKIAIQDANKDVNIIWIVQRLMQQHFSFFFIYTTDICLHFIRRIVAQLQNFCCSLTLLLIYVRFSWKKKTHIFFTWYLKFVILDGGQNGTWNAEMFEQTFIKSLILVSQICFGVVSFVWKFCFYIFPWFFLLFFRLKQY